MQALSSVDGSAVAVAASMLGSMQQAGISLPAGWVEYQDAGSGQTYYHCVTTGETTWTRPSPAAAAPELASTVAAMGTPQVAPGQVQGVASAQQMLGCMQADMPQPAALPMQQACAMQGMATTAAGAAASFIAAVGGSANGVLCGTVKTWNEERGFGFITPNTGGEDIFVHRSALNDGQVLLPGAYVQYDVFWNAQRGKYAASKVIGAAGKGIGGPATGMSNPGSCSGMQIATPGMPPLPAPGATASALSGMGGSTYSGTVKAWYLDKGFGFIIPEGGGDDVFVHRNDLADGGFLVQGYPVRYELTWNPQKGKYGATCCYGAVAEQNGMAGQGAVPSSGKGYSRNLPDPSDNLFVAGLPPSISEQSVMDLFSQYGNVLDCKVLPDSGKPDRACLVRMGDLEQAKWVVENMNGIAPPGLNSTISVRYADNPAGKGKGKSKGAEPGGFGKIPSDGLTDNRYDPYSCGFAVYPCAGATMPTAANTTFAC